MKNLVGQYLDEQRIVRLLGRTAFSEVYLIEGSSPDKRSVLKVLRVELSEDQRRSFLLASRALVNLVHPHIIRVEGLNIVQLEKNFPALLMEHAPNGNLRQRHPIGSRLPLTTVLPYVSTIAEALHYAHLQNFVHGDIKPENILLGSNNRILLSDFSFGLISSIKEIEMSTTAYLAPEQIVGEPDLLSDEYALGVMVYEWLSGELPFSGSLVEIADQHLYAPPPPLSTKIPGISPDIEEVVLRALAKDPRDRFANLLSFADALKQASQTTVPYSSVLSNLNGASNLSTAISRPFTRRISRRAIVVGLPVLAVAGGGLIAWLLSQHESSNTIADNHPLLVYLGHTAGVTAVAWSPDGKYIASGGNDHTIRIWNAKTGADRLILHGLSGGVPAISWSPDSTLIASATSGPSVSGGPPASGNAVQVWNATTGKSVYIYQGHTNGITDIAWSPTDNRIASSSTDYTVQIWDATTGQHPLIYRTHSWYVWTLAWSPDGKRLASGEPDGTIQVWDAATGQTFLFFRGHTAAVEAVAWSPDGKYIASASDDYTVRIWNSASGKPVYIYRGHSSYVSTVAWSPNGHFIASGSNDKTMQVWDSATGKTSYTYRGYSGSVTALTWSPDGKYIASSSEDGSVQVVQVS
jgi:eukaryotic-like serine/threonine-protein kinase